MPDIGLDDRPEDCATRISLGLGTGFFLGNILGAIASTWDDVPLVLKNKPWPALVRTGSVMMNYGTSLGLVGLTYSTVDCVAESIRGKKDWLNGTLGGAASGVVLGIRVGKLKSAVSAAALLATLSAAMEAADGKFSGNIIDDGATPPKKILPFES